MGEYNATSLSDRNAAMLMVWARARPLSRLGRVLRSRSVSGAWCALPQKQTFISALSMSALRPADINPNRYCRNQGIVR
jgi:hypothetical protein